ncbi:MAG: M56 family metallopeptidase [Lachnospiraceae bacterium]|nr:M56 family metallopeptidase [Lachnospiraceae bacterium]
MNTVFLYALNMSISAGWIILAVLLLRLLFRKAPKRYTILFWIPVALRLIQPFPPESPFSLLPSVETVPVTIEKAPLPTVRTGMDIIDRAVNPVLAEKFAPDPAASINPMQIAVGVLSTVWIIGVGVMFLYLLVSVITVYRKTRISVPDGDGVRLADGISSPFLFGIFRPTVFLPSGIGENEKKYVLLHEKAHIRRKDHILKPFAFLLLSFYWFHPLIWAAFLLFCRDAEYACDEAVLSDMETDDVKAYTASLLSLSVKGNAVSACPIAFGETDVKGRVRAALSGKKTAEWIILILLLALVLTGVFFLTSPKNEFHEPWDGGFCTRTDNGKEVVLVGEQKQSILSALNYGKWYAEDQFQFAEKDKLEYDYRFSTDRASILYCTRFGVFKNTADGKMMSLDGNVIGVSLSWHRLYFLLCSAQSPYLTDNNTEVDVSLTTFDQKTFRFTLLFENVSDHDVTIPSSSTAMSMDYEGNIDEIFDNTENELPSYLLHPGETVKISYDYSWLRPNIKGRLLHIDFPLYEVRDNQYGNSTVGLLIQP